MARDVWSDAPILDEVYPRPFLDTTFSDRGAAVADALGGRSGAIWRR